MVPTETSTRVALLSIRHAATSARIAIVVALALFVGLLAAGCGSASSQTAKTLAFADGRFQAKDFVDPRVGSNKWLPLKPGTQWVRNGTTLVGNRAVPHKVLSTVTDVIRVIGGVKTVAVLDHSVDSGQVVQQSLDYFAQDKSGNIWDFGAATEQYEAGRFVTVDEAWVAGVEGAKPGVQMLANPTSSSPPWAIAQPPGEDGDAAGFQRTQKRECVPFGCFDNVLVVEEGKKSALNNEYKYYAAGVGQIRNEPLGASRHQDIETLVNFTLLSPAGLAEASKRRCGSMLRRRACSRRCSATARRRERDAVARHRRSGGEPSVEAARSEQSVSDRTGHDVSALGSRPRPGRCRPRNSPFSPRSYWARRRCHRR